MIKLYIPDHPIFLEAAARYFAEKAAAKAPTERETIQAPSKAERDIADVFRGLPPVDPYPSQFDAVATPGGPDPEAAAAFGSAIPESVLPLNPPTALATLPAGLQLPSAPETHPHLYPPVQTLTPPAPVETHEFGSYNVGQLDGRGFPWDERIHSSSKVQLAKKPHGWKPLRGVSPALVAAVEAELTAAGKTGQPPVAVKPNAPTPVPVPAAPIVPVGPPQNFADLANRLGVADKFTTLGPILQAVGVESFQLLAHRPDLWGAVAAMAGV